jgi:hypothetical protein
METKYTYVNVSNVFLEEMPDFLSYCTSGIYDLKELKENPYTMIGEFCRFIEKYFLDDKTSVLF